MKGSVVWITGASSGIGAELAVQFAARGATVALSARSTDKLREMLARLDRGAGQRHEALALDVTRDDQTAQAAEALRSRHGRIDVLVNNAGYAVFEACVDAPMTQYMSMMDVNYFGTVRCTKAVLPGMLQEGRGHIVNVASIVGKIGSAKSTAYAASKHAVLGFTNSLRLELAGRGVTVTAINPGPVRTPFFDIADPQGFYAGNPRVQKFMLRPEQVAQAIVEAVLQRREEVDIPYLAGAAARLFHLFPRMFERLSGKFMNLK